MSKLLKLRDIGKVRMCKRILKEQTSINEEIPFFKISTFGNKADTFISKNIFEAYKAKYPYPKNGDILISAAGTLGKTVIYRGDDYYYQDSNIVWLEHNEEVILNSYLYYFYKTSPWVSTNGSTILRLYNDNILDIELSVPDIVTQQKIAAVLSALDNKIELNNKINAELEETAKTLYDYWFGQFDFPNEDSKPYKSSGGKMVYNSILKREIPEGWEVTVFNDWIKQTKTGDWGKEAIEGNYTVRVYCVRGADINGLNGKGEVKAPERFILQNNLSKKLEPNDFIIEISGGSPTQSTARLALLTKESFDRFDTDVVCSNFCKAVTLKDEAFAFNFQQEWQRLYDAGVFFGFEGKTSGIKNFLFESFMESYHIVKPNKDLVLRYNSIAKELEKKKQSNLKQNQELAQLRDWLLPMLMNGQVKVAEALEATEKQLAMVAEPSVDYKIKDDIKENRFALWLSNQKLAARGDIDEVVLREIFDAMDDEDQ